MKTVNYPRVPLVLSILMCFFIGVHSGRECAQGKRLSTSKLVCYYSSLDEVDGCYCTHVILPANSDIKGIEKVKEQTKGVKVYVSVNEFNQGLIDLLKTSKVDGLELNLRKLDSKNDIADFISTVKTKIGTDLDIALSVPAKADLVAKYFDFKALSKHADLFILQTAFLGASTNVTFHPSRLSGMWDMQNTDSVVDLVNGLGAPLSKLVVTAPVQAFQFTLQNQEYTAPGSPALELQSITRKELCKMMQKNKNWTLERDEDQAGPYIFSKNQWIAFEDSKSMDIKAKYSRVRGLAGIALKDLAQDDGSECGSTILEAAYNGLSRQARAPRGAVLHSLEREIVDSSAKPLDSVQLSPFRISRVIDTEGKVHVVRQDSRTEFQCSRQGYFVHPRSCNRFYRCVKFNQLSDDYNVFEFDCPAGLAFDERVEVCVWPGSLPHGTPCSGSSEIAPVPRERFVCPSEPGYYADPENCRWFFACLDHGKSPLSAYEFRCPFGLVFDGDRLVCEWSWLVPKCAGGLGVGLDSDYYYGGAGNGNALGNGNNNVKGLQASGIVLQNYNGLGTLGVIKLGGLSGTIEKPIATVYSNVGAGTLGLGYQNSAGYIEGGGLNYKAAQALQNAGLLKVNNGVGYQATGQNEQGVLYAAAGHTVDGTSYNQHSAQSGVNEGAILIQAGENYPSGANAYAAGQYQASGGLQGTVNLVANDYGSGGAILKGSGQQSGAVSSQSFTQYQGAGEHSDHVQYQGANAYVGSGDAYATNGETNSYIIQNNAGGYEASKQGLQVAGSVDINKQSGEYVNLGSNYAQGSSGYVNTGSYVTGGNDFANIDSGFKLKVQGGDGGAVSTQSFTQYHGQGELKNTNQFDAGVAGNINIVGGGYSAVGAPSGIEISDNGEAEVVSVSPTYAPVSKIASIPIVTAVPVPGIKTVAGFETVKGGVIANIPELQYKVKSLEDAGLFTNISSSFANFVVTSPATDQREIVQQTYAQNGGYIYNRPSNAFEEGAINTVTISTARPFVSVTTGRPQVYVSSTVKPFTVVGQKSQEGYVYEKPAITFQEAPQVYSTPQPVAVQPAVSSITFQKYDSNGGYKYEKPLVGFEERPQQGIYVDTYSSVSTPKPAIIVQQQPQIVVSSTPASPAVSSYSYTQEVNDNQAGYVYEQEPQIISKFTIRKPVIPQTVSGVHYYQKPTVQQPTIVNEIPSVQLKQKTVVEDYSYHQPAEVSQYYYQQPSVKQQPIVPLYQQPELLSTYTYQPPVQKQPVSTYTYQNVAQQAVGVAYKRPELTLVQKPVQAYSYQPSGGTSYQYINFENNQQQKSQGGYVYSKPTITFEELPQVALVDTYQHSTPKPVVIEEEIKPQGGGYVYEKPAVTFKETPINYSTPKSVVAVQPAVVTRYFNIANGKAETESAVQQNNVGYTYPKPAVHFEESPVVTYSTVRPITIQPVVPTVASVKNSVVTSYFNIANSKANAENSLQQENVGYTYPKPTVSFEETPITYSTPKPVVPVQPAVVTSYFNIANSKDNVESSLQQANVGYTYRKPTVSFEETPITYSTPKPVVPVQPAVVTSYFNIANSKDNVESSLQQANVGYTYPKPTVSFEETPITYSTPKPVVAVEPAVVTSYFNIANSKASEENSIQQANIGYSYPKPTVSFEETPITYSTPKPFVIQPVVTAKPAVVSSYFNFASSEANSKTNVQQQNVGYVYSKPAIRFEETPVTYSTARPAVVESVIPAEVTSYFNIGSNKANSEVVVEQQRVGYTYPKATVQFKDTPKPAVVAIQPVQPSVTSYFNIGSSTSKPVYVQEERVGYAYPKPEIRFEEKPIQPAVISSYNYIQSTTPQPHLIVEPEQPAIYTPKPQPAVVTSYFHQQPSKGYEYPRPSIQFEDKRQPIEEVPFVKKTAYVTGEYQQNSQENYNYQQNYQHTGKVVVENYQLPEYEKVKQAVFGQKTYQQQDQVQYQQPQVVLNYIQSTPKPTFVSTIRTIARQKVQPVTPATVTMYDSRYSSTPESYISPTVAPEVHVVSTTSRPISRYSFSSLDDQYQYNDVVKSTTVEPIRTYLPVTSTVRITSALPKITKNRVVEEFVAPEVTTLSRDYLPVIVRTKTPAREYLPVEISTPSNEYLPVPTKEYLPSRRVKVSSTTEAPEITTLSREYLPVKTRLRVTTGSPSYTIRPKVTRPVTVIRQNDAHPLLAAKLGAQCTCVSNTLRLRKKQKIIVVDDDENGDDDDDGYVVDNENQGNLVKSYGYEPQRVVELNLKSSTVEPQTYIKKRVKVRPVAVSEVSEIFYQKNRSPALVADDSTASDKDIVKAVRTGLKLVKQAAKEGAREGTQEIISKQLDRYGPGGVRSRSESLQGSIDCQRAGLFRHPNECNKFYACRWDCTKKRFTLHVFNCPVHLTFDNTLGACNWPSQGPACVENTLITSD